MRSDRLKHFLRLSLILLCPLALMAGCDSNTEFDKSFSQAPPVIEDQPSGPVFGPDPVPFPSSAAESSTGVEKGTQTVSASPSSDWLQVIQTCVDHLSTNSYVSGGNKLNCESAVAQLDCSGFINDVAEVFFPQAYKILNTHGRPTVSTYYDLITKKADASPELASVKTMPELQAGDIITWIFGTAQRAAMNATGHMMLVLAPAEQVTTTPPVFKVYVADAAESSHEQDTRPKGQKGLGMGYIYFETNAGNEPIAYGWSEPADWVSNLPIAMGRMINPAR